MTHFLKYLFTTLPLFAFGLLLQSCNDDGVQFDKQKVQFSLSSASTYSPGVTDIDLPENARAKISVSSSSGTSILSDYEIPVFKNGDIYVTDLVELAPGSYMVTDFMIVKDSVDLYVTPKKGAEFTTSEADALPYHFSIAEKNATTVSMRVVDVRDQDLQKFGYASSKGKSNSLSIAVYETIGGTHSLTSATAELRQNKKLLKVFSLPASVNTIALEGDPKVPYTMTVYTATSAKTQTFNMTQKKNDGKKNPLQIILEPALILTIESYVEEGNEYEEYFDFRMTGNGAVNINWGDGEQSAATLPFEVSHEYITGNYTAIVTGDISQVTDFSGFSYGSIISAITGLTNLTSLKTYNPSWGAVPIKVDLSNCEQLETINIAKYGAPYEPIDLRTDFKLPAEHHISTFIFDATSFDITREFISAEELEAMFDNIYSNAVSRNINDGKFFVNPVEPPTPETQQKIDALKNENNWEVGFNDEIYEAYSFDSGRRGSASDSNERREQWLRERFSNGQQIIERAHVAASMN